MRAPAAGRPPGLSFLGVLLVCRDAERCAAAAGDGGMQCGGSGFRPAVLLLNAVARLVPTACCNNLAPSLRRQAVCVALSLNSFEARFKQLHLVRAQKSKMY